MLFAGRPLTWLRKWSEFFALHTLFKSYCWGLGTRDAYWFYLNLFYFEKVLFSFTLTLS